MGLSSSCMHNKVALAPTAIKLKNTSLKRRTILDEDIIPYYGHHKSDISTDSCNHKPKSNLLGSNAQGYSPRMPTGACGWEVFVDSVGIGLVVREYKQGSFTILIIQMQDGQKLRIGDNISDCSINANCNNLRLDDIIFMNKLV